MKTVYLIVLNKHTVITCWASSPEDARRLAEIECREELDYRDLPDDTTILPVHRGEPCEVIDLREAL